MLDEQLLPDLGVPTLDFGQAREDMLPLGIALDGREHAVQERSVTLVLSMMREGFEVGRAGGFGGGRSHVEKYGGWEKGGGAPGQPSTRERVSHPVNRTFQLRSYAFHQQSADAERCRGA